MSVDSSCGLIDCVDGLDGVNGLLNLFASFFIIKSPLFSVTFLQGPRRGGLDHYIFVYFSKPGLCVTKKVHFIILCQFVTRCFIRIKN